MEENKNQNNRNMVRVYKRIVGSLGVSFENYNSGTPYVLRIPSEQEFKPLPIDYVVSMFYLPSTLKAFNRGLWTLNDKDKEKVASRAKELGLYFENEDGPDDMDQPEVLYSEREIISFLERKRMKEIDNVIENGSAEQKKMLVSAASEMSDKLSGETINLLEEKLKIAIQERD